MAKDNVNSTSKSHVSQLSRRLPASVSLREIIMNPQPKTRLERVGESLSVQTPAAATSRLTAIQDEEGFLILACTDVIPYDRDPRTTINPEFKAIKESIRQRGFTDTLTVTRRTPEHPYMLSRGGNTRLRIVQQLWDETKDERFRTIRCVFVPWVSEIDTFTAHLVENEARGDTSFFDKAMGVADLKAMLEQREDRVLKIADLAQHTRNLGMTRSTSVLVEYLFAARYLSPLKQWLTHTDSQRIRSHHQKLEREAKEHNLVPGHLDTQLRAVYQEMESDTDASHLKADYVIERMSAAAAGIMPRISIAEPSSFEPLTSPIFGSASDPHSAKKPRQSKKRQVVAPAWLESFEQWCEASSVTSDEVLLFLRSK
ncbi:ParB family protein [Nitrogeniibacter aestuarii]|uniref:ParB family protein n=1 Tax=Nitrogeniibacter aestuarii TaxID=2815343 RepID=UPI001E44891D|nr:ParB family protein [Nitrogeniibacter aestuarii]